MLRKCILLAVCVLGGLSFSQIALSEEEILLFGPETFTRGKEKPVIASETFFALEPSPETTLNIFNGDANGDFGVSSAKIHLNGKLVVGPRNFNQKVDSISAPVALRDGENIIEVELRSKPGSFISVNITAPGIVVGPEGGTVTTTAGTKIEIPPGALTEDTVITVETLTEETLPAPVPEGLGFLGGADFRPDGLTFNVPVTITIPLSISLPPGSFLGFFVFDPEAGEFVYAEKYGTVDESGEAASIEIGRFSAVAFLRDVLLRVTIIGRVVTKDDEPVANAEVTITSVTDEVDNVFRPDAPTVTTRQDGFFAVSFRTDYLLKFFKAEAVHAPSGAEGEASGNIQETFNFGAFAATLLGVPTDWPGLAAFVLQLLTGAGPPPRYLTTDLIGYGGGVKIEVEALKQIWYDKYGYTWTLQKTDSSVTGTVDVGGPVPWTVTGTMTQTDVHWHAVNPTYPEPWYYTWYFDYYGTLSADGTYASGNWTNYHGFSGTWWATQSTSSSLSLSSYEHESEPAMATRGEPKGEGKAKGKARIDNIVP